MAPTVTRLLLSFCLVVATPVVYVLGVIVLDSQLRLYRNFGVLTTWTLLSLAAFGLLWTLIWRQEVRWTRRRRIATQLAVVACVLLGVLVCVIFVTILGYRNRISEEIVMLGGMCAATAWLGATAWAWRETPEERRGRLAAATGNRELPCPQCGYNLTGLREARCPECGASYTLESLIAAVTEQKSGHGLHESKS